MNQTTVIRINGYEYWEDVRSDTTLLDFIRDRAQLTGTKKGCDNGDCGACTVLLNGKAVLSCMMLALQADRCDVITIEGLTSGDGLHPVQQAFVDSGAIQCGYCTPGMVMAAIGLLSVNPCPTEADIRLAMVGHLCRCSGYKNIVKAVGMAAKSLAEHCGDGKVLPYQMGIKA